METKKKKTAVALAYEPNDKAPKILATGEGYVAEKIEQVAVDAKVPIYQDESLAKTLSSLQIGEYIPKELYQAVAEILVFVDEIEQLKKKKNL